MLRKTKTKEFKPQYKWSELIVNIEKALGKYKYMLSMWCLYMSCNVLKVEDKD